MTPITNREEVPNLPFSLDEYEKRIQNVRAEMACIDMELFLITEPENIYYLTGFQTVGDPPVNALFLPIKDLPYMITRALEQSNIDFRTYLSQDQRASYQDYEDPYSVTIRYLIKKNHAKCTIGLEYKSKKHKPWLYKALKKGLPHARFLDGSDIIGNLRLIKSDSELNYIREAVKMTASAMKNMIHATKVGTGENNIAAVGYNTLFTMGSTYAGYPVFVSSGPHGALGHAASDTRIIQDGDLVFLELTGVYRRYAGPIMRTVYVGDELPPYLKILQEGIDDAVSKMMQAMKPGVRCSQVDAIARDILAECSKEVQRVCGLKVTQLARSAYSVGINFMVDWGEGEYLSLDPAECRELAQGMVFHLIPWVQIFDSDGHPVGGIGLSETVLVTAGGGVSFFEGYNLPRKIVLAGNTRPIEKSIVFCSDNAAPAHPKILEGLAIVNSDHQLAYGNDCVTKAAVNQLAQLFPNKQCKPFIVSNGTAANILAISTFVTSVDLVICHQESHLFWDECGALEKYSGCKLVTCTSLDGKVYPGDLQKILDKYPDIPHRSKPTLVSITQPTEKGTVYTLEELRALAAFCTDNNLLLHMDGTRFANALVALGCRPQDIIDAGAVDVLTFGFSKNGAIDAEAVIFFGHSSQDIERRIKQMGQLKAKGRYVARQILDMLDSDLYLQCATRANHSAKQLAEGVDPSFVMRPVDTNMIFYRVDKKTKEYILQRYAAIAYPVAEQNDRWDIRFVTSWATSDKDLVEFKEYLHKI